MQNDFTYITQSDGYQTKLHRYYTDCETILGSVLILHGMAEYHVRYIEFAGKLNAAGYDVYLYDHRGHGEDCAPENLGFFAEENGTELLIQDAVTLCQYVRENGRSDKLAVFGHSMGSLILRNVIQRYDRMDCVVICGTTMPDFAVAKAGHAIANLLCKVQGPRHRSNFLNNMMFGNKYYKEICTRTPHDWLTTDEAVVDWYRENPYCGFICTTSMYRDLLGFVKGAGEKALISRTRKDLPIFLIAGGKDPVGAFGSEVDRLFDLLMKLGFEKLTEDLFPDARHEILNESVKDEVVEEILEFFHDHM